MIGTLLVLDGGMMGVLVAAGGILFSAVLAAAEVSRKS